MTTRFCIFDMDGVLIDSGVHHRNAWQALLDELGVTPTDPGYWRHSIGRPAEEAMPLMLGRPVSASEARHLALRKRELYGELAQRGTLTVAGVPSFVAALVRDKVPRGVGTSASRWDVDTLLTKLGLKSQFDAIVTAEDVKLGKPDPQVYLEVAKRLQAPPAECVVFEDSLVGVEAARRAGMRAIGVTTSHSDAELRESGAESAIPNFEGVAWSAIAR